MTEETPTIEVGQTIPDALIQIKSEEGVDRSKQPIILGIAV